MAGGSEQEGWSVTAEGDRTSARLGLRWTHPLAAEEVAGWEVSLGWGSWQLPWPHTGSDPEVVLPWRMLAAPVDCRLELLLTARSAEGEVLGTGRLTVALPPFDLFAPSTDWDLGEAEVVVDDALRRAAGRTYWPDGTVGFAPGPDGVVRCWAPDGRLLLRPDGSGPAVGVPSSVLAGPHGIEGTIEPADYASGGPVLDVGGGVLAMVWHGEEHVGGDPDDFWGFLGLARSTDGGQTFHDLGRIVTPHIRADSPRRVLHVEVGGGSCATSDDGYLHVYYRDTLDTGSSAPALGLSVARVGLWDLVAAVHDGRAPVLEKWRDGAWSQPGLGGSADDLLPRGVSLPRWFDVIRHDEVGWLMVGTGGLAVDWTYVVRTSPDGLTWSDGELLGEPVRDAEVLYLTLSGDDLGTSRRAVDDVWLWRTRSADAAGSRWDDARFERLRLARRV